jgi:predicted esterase
MKYLYTLLLVSVFISTLFLSDNTLLAAEGEINYATIQDVRGTDIYVRYRGPWGEEFFLCDVGIYECEPEGDDAPDFTPKILGKTDYISSPDGHYAVINLSVNSSAPLYIMYDTSGDAPIFKTIIPYQSVASRILFSPLSSHVFFFGSAGEIFRHNIKTFESKTMVASQADFPMRIISPNGTYVSAYNYGSEVHKIWNTDTGTETLLSGESPSYVEFSEDERYAAYTDNRDSFDSLYLMDLRLGTAPVKITTGDFTVVDHLFVDNNLYYISNEDGVYDWSLYQYEPQTGERQRISQNASYGDYLGRISGKLSFLVLEGKNTNVALYDPASDSVSVMRPMGESPTSEDIRREVIETNGNHAALLEPKNSRDNEDTLFIWLHGGPQRQTAPAYHSYLSYAVYDEILDKLVESGATVLKLDYTGSFGYGKEFIDELKDRIGEVDVQDVLSAVEDLNDDNDYDKIYLIGNSYGGYLSLRSLVEEPKTFDGAVGINGVYDWASLITRIPSSPFKNLFQGVPNNLPGGNSRLYQTADIESRLSELDDQDILLFYGENDSTVPIWQTTEFTEVLEEADLEAETISFSDESHIILKKDNLNRICRGIAMLAGLSTKSCR